MLSDKTQPIPLSMTERELTEEADAEVGPARRRSAPFGRFLFALFWTLAGVGAILLLSVAWFRELDRRKDAEKSAATAHADIRVLENRVGELEGSAAVLEDKLAGARREMRAARVRASVRAETLRSTRGVLAQVPPLRQAYEDVGEILVAMETNRAGIASWATAIRRDVATLTRYLQETDEAALSERELRKRVTTLREHVASLRGAQASFAEKALEYGQATEAVDERFEQLGDAAAALRKRIARALRRPA